MAQSAAAQSGMIFDDAGDEREPFAAYLTDDASQAAAQTVANQRGWSTSSIRKGGLAAARRLLGVAPPARFLIVDVEGEPIEEVVSGLTELARLGSQVMVLGTLNDVNYFRRIMQTGARDYLVKPVDADMLGEIFVRLEQPGDGVTPKGRVVGFVGARGGVGTTTLGINTAADATNRFALKSNAALFTAIYAADGGNGDVQHKINKESESDTASQLYQTDFSGRAETGLCGDEDFHIKVSPDGSAWREALLVEGDSGHATFSMNDGALPLPSNKPSEMFVLPTSTASSIPASFDMDARVACRIRTDGTRGPAGVPQSTLTRDGGFAGRVRGRPRSIRSRASARRARAPTRRPQRTSRAPRGRPAPPSRRSRGTGAPRSRARSPARRSRRDLPPIPEGRTTRAIGATRTTARASRPTRRRT